MKPKKTATRYCPACGKLGPSTYDLPGFWGYIFPTSGQWICDKCAAPTRASKNEGLEVRVILLGVVLGMVCWAI